MAFQDMAFEISGELNIPMPLTQTKIQEALLDIYQDEEQRMWSFQLREAGWLTPGLVFATGFPGAPHFLTSEGMITVAPFATEIKGDAVAAAAWRAYQGRPPLTELQIRSPFFSLYDIIHFDGVDTLEIDRPWMEPQPGPPFLPSGTPPNGPQPYLIYQAFFVAPVQDFKRFFVINDFLNAGLLDYWSYSQRDLTMRDPQRTVFDLPAYVVFKDWDQRGAGTACESPTLGFPRFELWPHPLSQLTYTFSYLRMGPPLVFPSDTLPIPITESMLKWKTRENLYLFKEGQKGDGVLRGSGADWHFLAESAAAEYKAARNRVGKRDQDLVDLFFVRFRRQIAERGGPFATIQGQLNVGTWEGG